MDTMLFTGELVRVTCWCGMTYAIPAALDKHATSQRDNRIPETQRTEIFCPLGHTWIRSGKSRLDLAKEELERVQREKIWAENRANRIQLERDAAQRQASAYKGQATRARKRAAAALCPVEGCGRSFVQIARHLTTKHPDYVAEHAHG